MKKLVGVAACPAGIAHTYLAAESIVQAAKEMGYEVKMETNGAGGVENELSDQDIKEADAVVIAADTFVEMERFHGKQLLEVSVSMAVRNGKKVIETIEAGNLEIYKAY
ncbi:PTS fructose transporter subunit IIB [Amedibacillus sp. YH-ame10]